MNINSLMTIYHILTDEVEKRERAHNAAREELKEAQEIDDNEGHIECLSTIRKQLLDDYIDAKRALDDFTAKDWN